MTLDNHHLPSSSRKSSVIHEDETDSSPKNVHDRAHEHDHDQEQSGLTRQQSTKSVASDVSSVSSYHHHHHHHHQHIPHGTKFQNRYSSSNRSYNSRRRGTTSSKSSYHSHRRDFSYTSQYSLASTELPTPTPGSTRIQKQFFVRDENKEPEVVHVAVSSKPHPTMSSIQPHITNSPGKHVVSLEHIDSPTPSMSTITKSNKSNKSTKSNTYSLRSAASARPDQNMKDVNSMSVESPHSTSLRRQSLLSVYVYIYIHCGNGICK